MTITKYGRFPGVTTLDLRQPPFNANPWTRLCLPADYSDPNLDQEFAWHQKQAKTFGNPWVDPVRTDYRGVVAAVSVNSGSSVALHRVSDYWAIPAGKDLMGHRNESNWSLDKPNTRFSFEFYLDSDHTAAQWCLAEAYIPDAVGNVKLHYWDQAASQWVEFADYATPSCSQAKSLAGNLKDAVVYTVGVRGETKPRRANSGGTPPANITYTSQRGCRGRFGFGVYLPADDGLDSATAGDSQVKLKVEVYYADDGKATYEFEDSADEYYGLQNVNKEYLVLLHPTLSIASFIQLESLSKLPTSLTVTADHDERITQVAVGYAAKALMFWGQCDTDPSLDSDADGIPDVIEDVEAFIDGGGFA